MLRLLGETNYRAKPGARKLSGQRKRILKKREKRPKRKEKKTGGRWKEKGPSRNQGTAR